MLGLWAGYLIYGLIFNYQISTHDYYHMPLVPIVALSLAPLSEWFIQQLMAIRGVRRSMPRVLLSILLMVLVVTAWRAHERLHQIDYRTEVAPYKNIGEKIGRKFKVVALTEDYGYRLAYWGWLNARG